VIQNTCQVCGRAIYPEGPEPVIARVDEHYEGEVPVFITIGKWDRRFVMCSACGRRLILEVESFSKDGKAYEDLSLGDLQKRLDSMKDG